MSIDLSDASISSKQLNISQTFFTVGWPHHSDFAVPNNMAISNIPTGAALKEASNAGGMIFDQYLGNDFKVTPLFDAEYLRNGQDTDIH